jgi:DnaJ homolog subfamily C member 28
MDFVDWRKEPKEIRELEAAQARANRYQRKRMGDYVEEMIQEAQERGDFANLPGAGKPLQLEEDRGEQAMAYRVLKNNGCAPPEIELGKEIRTVRERAEARLAKVVHQGKVLRARRMLPFTSEKRAFNTTVEKVAEEYEQTLRELNSKILTLNLTAPSAMHQSPLDIERLMLQFRASCPLFDL